MGKLCIVSNAEGLSENVLHEETGWVVPKYSSKMLADQLRKVLLMDVSEKNVIAQNAMLRVKNDFNMEKQQQDFRGFYV